MGDGEYIQAHGRKVRVVWYSQDKIWEDQRCNTIKWSFLRVKIRINMKSTHYGCRKTKVYL